MKYINNTGAQIKNVIIYTINALARFRLSSYDPLDEFIFLSRCKQTRCLLLSTRITQFINMTTYQATLNKFFCFYVENVYMASIKPAIQLPCLKKLVTELYRDPVESSP